MDRMSEVIRTFLRNCRELFSYLSDVIIRATMKQRHLIITAIVMIVTISYLYKFHDKLSCSYISVRLLTVIGGYQISSCMCYIRRFGLSKRWNFFFWKFCPCALMLVYLFNVITAVCFKAIIFKLILISLVFIACEFIRTYHGLSKPKISEICEKQNLNIGYGAAAFYYHNYLKMFVPEKLKERIRHFESVHNVKVVSKLIILLPASGIIKQYIDETWQIERARELLPFHIDIAGIKQRTYNITVYHVRRDKKQDGIWCAIEYAQPLRQLYDLHREQEISDKEYFQELQLFRQNLADFLDDASGSHTVCELLSYNDRIQELNLAEKILDICKSSDTCI